MDDLKILVPKKIIKCDQCDYIASNNWNNKMHYFSAHSSKEERFLRYPKILPIPFL